MVRITESSVKRFLAEDLVPALLSASVVSSAAYIYAGGSAPATAAFTAVSVLYSFLLFAVYELLRKTGKTWLSTIAVGGMFVAAVSFGMRAADMRGGNELALWFMEPSRYTEIHYGNTYALIAVMGFVLISCLYYFTRIRYRGVFVFLICLCPFCLFAKTFTDIPVICPIIIMTLFFFIAAGRTGRTDASGAPLAEAKAADKGTFIAASAFILAVTVLASFFPKLESAPFRENFDEFITGVSIGAPGRSDFDDFSDTSSNATSDDEDTVVMMFYGEVPTYIKRQCFNMYDISGNIWTYYGDSDTGNSNWSRYTDFEDPTTLYAHTGFEGSPVTLHKCWVQSSTGRIKALYTPENLVSIELYDSDGKTYRTELDEYFVGRGSTVGSYILEWADVPIEREFAEMFTDEFANSVYYDDGTAGAHDAMTYINAKDQAVQYNDILMSDTIMDGCYSSKDGREQVKRLAERVTDGCTDDYERAAALTDFFKGGEYIYDDEFTAPDGSPDTFILNTKRGACASYATAMTLMCRELGMTARYCEGFLIQKMSDNGRYMYVTAGDAHAYVQVWIDGYGWTDFDPTSSVTDDGYFDMTFIYVGAGAALLVLIGALVIFMRPRLEEASFVRRMKRASGAAQYSLIYRRINGMINKYNSERTNTLTPTDTAAKSAEQFGCSIDDFVQLYEESVYGGITDQTPDCSEVYRRFAAAHKAKLREERKRKKK